MNPKIRQSVVAAASVIAVASTPMLLPAQAETQVPAPTGERYADMAFAATNDQRTERGLLALRERQCLTDFAKPWARHMAREQELVHQPLGPIMRRCHLSWAGENIAYGFSSGRTVVNQGWMNSEGHRENILRPAFRLMGIGAYRDSRGTWWVSQVFGRG